MSSPRLAEIEADAYEKKPQQSRQLRASDAAETPTDSAQGSPACGCSDTSPKVPTCLSQVGTDRQAGCLIALYHAQIIQRASPAMDRRIDGTGPHRPAQARTGPHRLCTTWAHRMDDNRNICTSHHNSFHYSFQRASSRICHRATNLPRYHRARPSMLGRRSKVTWRFSN
jgi:hypothetical protein